MSHQLLSIYHQLGSLIEQAREEGIEFPGMTAFRVATKMTSSNTRASSEREQSRIVRKEKLKARKSSEEKNKTNYSRKPRRLTTMKRRGIQRQSKKIIVSTTSHLKRNSPGFTSVCESVKMRKRQKTSYAEFFDSDASDKNDRDNSSSSSSEDEPKLDRRRTRTRRNIMTRKNSKPQQVQDSSAPAVIFPCDMCDFSSACPSTLTDHRLQHHTNELGETTTECSSPSSTGGSGADQDLNFESTVESVGAEPLTMPISDFTHTSNNLHGKGRSFKICPHCSEEFDSLYDYYLHSKRHVKRVFKCNQCSYVSRLQVGLNMHMKRHGKNDWKILPSVLEALTVSAPASPASDCSLHLATAGFVADAFADVNIVTIFPDWAQKSPTSPPLAKKQVKLLPPESSTSAFMCPLCQQKFQREFLLDSHMRSHSYEEKEVLCSTSSCQNPTADKLGLDEQIPTHKVSVAVQSTSQPQPADIFSPTNIIKVELLKDTNLSSDKVDPELRPNNFQLLSLTSRPEKYICYLCKYVCSEDSQLKTHIASHVIHSIAFDCSQCGLSFSNAQDVAQHNLNSHADLTHRPSVPTCAIRPNPKRPNPAELSQESGKSTEMLLDFLPQHQKNCLLSSSFLPTVNPGNCNNVKARRGPPKSKIICRYCSKKFKAKSILIVHERSHTGERPFKCSRCSFTASSSGNLKLHNASHRGQIFICNYCDYSGSNKRSIKAHQSKHHPETRAQAGKSSSHPVVAASALPFKKRSNLSAKKRRIVGTHQVMGLSPTDPSSSEEEKDVAPSEDNSDSDWCQESGNASETDGDARRKVLKCEFCPRQFGFMSQLRIHLRVHTGERPYSCPHCDYTTAYSNALTSHLACHTEVRPYKCKLCSYSSTLSYHVIAHLKRDHEKIVKAYGHSKSSLKKLISTRRRSE